MLLQPVAAAAISHGIIARDHSWDKQTEVRRWSQVQTPDRRWLHMNNKQVVYAATPAANDVMQ
jgi:hypothetical protein